MKKTLMMVWGYVGVLALALTMGCADGTTTPTSDIAGGDFGNDFGSCNEGQKRCNALGNVETCSGGSFTATEACTNGCSNGACGGSSCQSGETRCSSLGNIETCQGGSFSETEACSNGCSSGTCNPAGSCTEGNTQCNSSGNVETCQSGSFSQTEACSSGCSFGECISSTGCNDGDRRCNGSGNVETCSSGTFSQSESCSSGCINGACNSSIPASTCSNPTPFTVGGTVEGNTNNFNVNHDWSGACSGNYDDIKASGPETVLELNVPQTMAMELTVTPKNGAEYLGVYMRSNCNDAFSEVDEFCDGSRTPGERIVLRDIVAKGNYSIIVDSFSGYIGGEFDISAQQILPPTCGFPEDDPTPTLLDLSNVTSTPVVVTGQTDDGGGANVNGGGPKASWSNGNNDCPDAQIADTLGPEVVYSFALAEETTLTFSAKNIDTDLTKCNEGGGSSKCKMGIYLRTECGNEQSQMGCADAGNSSAIASFSQTLQPGSYYLFVDDFTIGSLDTTQRFELTITSP